ncbi:hypothetical protein P4H82_27445 [Bacillus cereus]|nr:hypothetical protein [Bacillus cereus]
MLNISINLISVSLFVSCVLTFASGVFMVEALRFQGEGRLRYTFLFLLSFIAMSALFMYDLQQS